MVLGNDGESVRSLRSFFLGFPLLNSHAISLFCEYDIGIDGSEVYPLSLSLHHPNFQGGLSMWIKKCQFSRIFGRSVGALCCPNSF